MLTTYLFICVTSGLLAGGIGYVRLGSTGALVGFFLLGVMFPAIGILFAAVAKRTVPAGWYPDPGQPDAWRWWDGQQWTGYSSASVEGKT